MVSHETKDCPRCRQAFECRSGDILRCQCESVKLVQRHRDFISGRYDDCLCAVCLDELRSECDINQFNQRLSDLVLRGR